MAGSSIDDGSHYSWPVGSKMNRPEIEIILYLIKNIVTQTFTPRTDLFKSTGFIDRLFNEDSLQVIAN